MKTGSDVRMLALMARVSKVREIQAKQKLAVALESRSAQQERTRSAQACANRSDEALQSALYGPAIRLERLPLLQELSAHVQTALAGERELLAECDRQATDQMGIARSRASQRERLEEKAATALENLKHAQEAQQLGFATEAWLARQRTEAV